MELVKYDSKDQIYGSDHRPVFLDLMLRMKPVQYMQIPVLTDPTKAKQ